MNNQQAEKEYVHELEKALSLYVQSIQKISTTSDERITRTLNMLSESVDRINKDIVKIKINKDFQINHDQIDFLTALNLSYMIVGELKNSIESVIQTLQFDDLVSQILNELNSEILLFSQKCSNSKKNIDIKMNYGNFDKINELRKMCSILEEYLNKEESGKVKQKNMERGDFEIF